MSLPYVTSPIVALKEALRERLLADAAVLAALREPKVFADPPRHAAFPYAAFVAAAARDNGTGSDEGHRIELALGVWSRGGGSRAALEAAAAVAGALRLPLPPLAGHRLVELLVQAAEPLALKDGETWRVLLRLRAVTEVL